MTPAMHRTQRLLLERAVMFLTWWANHDGECLADHQSIKKRLAAFLIEVKETLG